MPSIIANVNKFLVNSDYPVDKVIYLKSDSSSAWNTTITIPHGLTFTPLVGGYWSLGSGFTTNYEFFSGTFPAAPGFVFGREVDIKADSTNIVLTTTNTMGDTPAYYSRIYGIEPDGSNANLAPLVSSGDAMPMNTDDNYMKLITSGSFNMGTSASFTVTHNIGFPATSYMVSCWFTFAGYVWPMSSNSFMSVEPYINTLIFRNPNIYTIGTVFYRIYL